MRLNHDCVRHLLLTIEESPNTDYLFLRQLRDKPLLKEYTDEDILYTASKLMEANYIHAKPMKGDNKFF